MDDTLLIPAEVATILRTNTVTVYAAAKDGRLPHVIIWEGRRRPLLRFRRADIERLIGERRSDLVNG